MGWINTRSIASRGATDRRDRSTGIARIRAKNTGTAGGIVRLARINRCLRFIVSGRIQVRG